MHHPSNEDPDEGEGRQELVRDESPRERNESKVSKTVKKQIVIQNEAPWEGVERGKSFWFGVAIAILSGVISTVAAHLIITYFF